MRVHLFVPILSMRWISIQKYLFAVCLICAAPVGAQPTDPLVASAREAWARRDPARLAPLVEQARATRHPLAPWLDYWRMNLRLNEAEPEELQAFYERWPGSYQEDRLRNDWLLELGKRRDWANFAAEYPRFRMDDDLSVHCYASVAKPGLHKRDALTLWLAQREADTACALLAKTQLESGQWSSNEVWQKIRRSAEHNRLRAAVQAAEMLPQSLHTSVQLAFTAPLKLLRGPVSTRTQQELAALALVRLAAADADAANKAEDLLRQRYSKALPNDLAAWVYSQLGRIAGLRQQPDAADWFERALETAPKQAPAWSDDTLTWASRAALRGDAGKVRWPLLTEVLARKPDHLMDDESWRYWRGRSLMAQPGQTAVTEGRKLLQQLASPLSFYGQLAADDLGLQLALPPTPEPLTQTERASAAEHPGLSRALRMIALGLRSEGVREWNFSLRGLDERALLAAAQRACDAQVWDRCINTSERTRLQIDLAQRYPTPYRNQVVAQARAAGLDPADPYGLIRQESRFIMDARSSVGASGLMQVMPATAKWTAQKLGLGYSHERLNDPDFNLRIGMAYLRMVLQDFDGQLGLAAAAYNAGPGRPRRWREGGEFDAAAWAEAIPFTETRDYVQKVLANATVYARLLGQKHVPLRQRLGHTVGPRQTPENKDLP
jgi:soluble lytic murein transglycosylase